MNLNAIALFFRKDIVDLLTSRRTGYLIIFMPIMTLVFRLIFSAGTQEPVSWRLLVIGGEGLAPVMEMEARSTFEITHMTDEDEARELMQSEQKDAVLIFAADAAERLEAGTPPSVRMIFNNEGTIEPAVFVDFIRARLSEASGTVLAPLDVEYVGESAIDGLSSYGSEVFSMQFSLMAVIFISVMVFSMNLLEEREARTLDAAMIGPVNLRDILVAKMLVITFYSVLSALVTVAVFPPVSVNWFMLVMVFLLILPLSLGLGLWMGLASEDLHQCNIWSSVLSMVILISAFIRMVDFSSSPVLAAVASLLPGTPSVDGLRVALNGDTWPALLTAMWPHLIWVGIVAVLVVYSVRLYQQRQTSSTTL